jgi:sulfonate transport system ATP-binding protein
MSATPQYAAVALQGVSKRFGERLVLDRLDLTIEAGAFVSIVGRSGCGKSTLLRLVAGLEAPDDGAIAVGEERQRQAASQRGASAHTRIMFQEARLLPWKSVLGNVMLGCAASEREHARAALREVGLGGREHDWPAQLSGGQRQRVALARALVHRPSLLLLDEPFGALDALTRLEMHKLVERLWREHRLTALLVTHDVQEAVMLSDRVLYVEHGKIALNERVPLPRPRTRTTPAVAEIEGRILQRLLASDPPATVVDLKGLAA